MHLLRIYLLCFLSLLTTCSVAQDSSAYCRMRVSVLTCSPGNELYALFGHTALRITDPATASDYVFNYGTFEFSDPGFYTKFIRGKLPYMLAVESFENFMTVYRWEQRHVWEQEIPLPCTQKQALVEALQLNLQPENKYYQYDFFYDNCTTRIRDLMARYAGAKPEQAKLIQPGTTYRNLIHYFLDAGYKPWSKLGIDLLLGAPTDAVSTQSGAQFLPMYFMNALSQPGAGPAGTGVRPVLLYEAQKPAPTGYNYAPLLFTSLYSLGLLCLLWMGRGRVQRAARKWFAFTLFLLGALGLLLLFMWLGTDHQTCARNYNLLWAWPTHIIMAFALGRQQNWVIWYLRAMMALSGLALAVYFFLPQQMNVAFAPLLLLQGLGAHWHLKNKKHA